MISRLSGNPITWAWSHTSCCSLSLQKTHSTYSHLLQLPWLFTLRLLKKKSSCCWIFYLCVCIRLTQRSCRWIWRLSLYLWSQGGRPWPLEGVPCYTWPFESGVAGTILLLTLLTGTFGSSESLMWLCERPALTEVRDERVPATVQGCPVLVHWKLNASGGASGSWACFVPCGMDNEASVSTCRMERWGSLSHLKRAQVTYLICPRQARDMIWSRGASGLNVLYPGFFLCRTTRRSLSETLRPVSCSVHLENYHPNQSSQHGQNLITLPQESETLHLET